MITEMTLLGKRIVGWHRKWLDLRVIDNTVADEVIQAHHYSGKATTNRFKSFGVYWHGQHDIKGALQLGYGIRPHIKHTWGEGVTHKNSVEFDRMWLSDELPKFSESVTIACLCRYLRKVHPEIKFILSYADGSAGNTGIIYKASNFSPVGSIKADFYILDSGERVHPVTMWHRHGSRAWELLKSLYPGISKAEGRQWRFIYDLHR